MSLSRDYIKKQIIQTLSKLQSEQGTFGVIAQVMVEEAARMVGVIRATEGDYKADGLQSLFIACAHEAAAESHEINVRFGPVQLKRKIPNDYV
jgi:hypothetical protein